MQGQQPSVISLKTKADSLSQAISDPQLASDVNQMITKYEMLSATADVRTSHFI